MQRLFSAIALLLLLSAGTANAQRMRFGLEGGINFSNQTLKYEVLGDDEHDNFDSRTDAKAGFIIDAPVTRNFSFQPGFFFTQKGSDDFLNLNGVEMRINYLEVPLNFLYKVGRRRVGQVWLGGGPYVAAAIGGTVDRAGDDDLDIGNDDDDDIARIDYGVNLCLGYETPVGVFFRGNVGLGLANIWPEEIADEDFRLRNWGFGLSVGYLF